MLKSEKFFITRSIKLHLARSCSLFLGLTNSNSNPGSWTRTLFNSLISEFIYISEKISALTNGFGLDVIIDAAGGKQTPNVAIDLVKRGGKVILVAIYTHLSEIDFNDLVATEKLLIGSLAYQRDDLEDVLELIANNSVKTSELISKKIGLDDVIDKGFSEMMKTDKDVFRIIVTPSLPIDIN